MNKLNPTENQPANPQSSQRRTNPYIGPQTFTAEQAHLFFGREQEASELLSLVIINRVVLFFAQSGAGKSSLINTRLIPGLEAEGFEVLPVARVGGGQPSQAIPPQNIYAHTLMSYLDDRPALQATFAQRPLADLLPSLSWDGTAWRYQEEVNNAQPPDETADEADYEIQPRVLIIDQFEEILTTHPAAWAERADFFDQLRDALEADPYLWLVLTMREDYVASLSPFIHRLPGQLRARYHMERMEVDGALLAVREPARIGGRAFGPGVAEELVDNLREIRMLSQPETQLGQYLEPVQLQVVCYQLWDNLEDDRMTRGQDEGMNPESEHLVISQSDLARLGDVNDALIQFYEQALTSALADGGQGVTQRQLRDWFSNQMIIGGQTRNTAYCNPETGETAGLPNAIVDRLSAQFLLHTEVRAGGTWVELVHDRFVEPIQQANEQWQIRHPNPVSLAYQRWQESGEDGDELPDGFALRELEAFAEENPDLNADEQRFLSRSQNEAEAKAEAAAQARKRRGQLIWGGLITLVVLAALTGWALIQSNLAEQERVKAQEQTVLAENARATAESETVRAEAALGDATQARTEAETQAERAKAQTIFAEAETQRAETALNDAKIAQSNAAWQEDRFTESLLLATHAVQTGLALDPPKRISSADTVLRTGLQNMGGRLLMHGGSIHILALSPDGMWLATSGDNHTVWLWNVDQLDAQPRILGSHDERITVLTFSPDGKWLVTGSYDKTVRLWNVRQPDAQPRVLSWLYGVMALALSPDGKWLASSGDAGMALLWDLDESDAKPRILRSHYSDVRALAFSPDGKWLATGSDEGTAQLWSVEQPEAQSQDLSYPFYGSIDVLAFSPDGKWLAIGSDDKTVRLWDMSRPEGEPLILRGHNGIINVLAFSPDGKWLATGSHDYTARLWDMERPGVQSRILRGHKNWVLDVAFSPDGKWLATGSYDQTARLWDVDQPDAQSQALRGHDSGVIAVTFNPDRKWLITSSHDETARLWDMVQPEAKSQVLHGHKDRIRELVFSPNGKWLATGSEDNTARLWDVDRPDAEFRSSLSHEGSVMELAFSPDGKWLATGSHDNMARLWDVDDPGVQPRVLRGHEDGVIELAFSGDGKWLATGSQDHTARLWDVENPDAQSRVLRGQGNWISALAFSLDGKWLNTGSYDSTAWLWDVDKPNAQPRRTLGSHGYSTAVAFSPDGKWLATADNDEIIWLWDVGQPNAEPRDLHGHEKMILQLVFSPDGKWLAAGGDGNTARLWNLDHPDPKPRILHGHKDSARALAFSPDGKWLATGSDDKTVRLWDVDESDTEPRVLHGHENSVRALAFSPDGKWLATGSDDNTARLWRLRPLELIVQSCQITHRNFNWAEWDRYFQKQPYQIICPDRPVPIDVLDAMLESEEEQGPLLEWDVPVTGTTAVTSFWHFTGTAGQVVTISLTDTEESEFDPYLVLMNARGWKIADDDNSGGGWDGRDALIKEAILPEDGVYFIWTGQPGSAPGSMDVYELLLIDEP